VDVPLAAERTIERGEQHLTVWAQGEPEQVPAPFEPYCYARQPFGHEPLRQREVRRRPLSTLDEETWIEAEFANVRELADAAHERPTDQVAEAHIPFVHRVLLDRPDFYRSFPNGEPSVLTFDVEQATTGEGFPDAEAPIVSIAWAFGDEPARSVVDVDDEGAVLEAFLGALEAHDPDVLAGYNAASYDLPRLLARLRAHGLDETPLHREGGRVEEARWGQGTRLVGRVLYDVYEKVRADQTLIGIKDRRLETVAAWHDLDVIEADTSNTLRLARRGELGRYNENDVELTRQIGRPYLANDVELADFYGAPLQTIDEATASFHARTLQGRIFVEEGVISDGTNEQRFPDLYEQTGGEGFVGGIVDIYRRGLFRPVTLVDFSSMYPSILVALGAGADNTRYEGTVREGGFEAHRKADTLTLRVPDPNRGTRHEVSIEGRSALAERLGELLAYRLDLKREARSAEGSSQDTSKQGMIKVILNSVYGVMASRHARYASLPVAMAIVGTARHLIRKVEDMLGEAKVETDTDGVYAEGTIDPDPIEARVNRWLADELGAEPVLSVDADRFEAGWFHEGKNYLLLHEDGRIERHGVAFKGSSRPPVFDEVLDRVARALLEGREDVDEIASQALDLSRYEREDFVQRVRLGKDPGDYEAPSHLAAQVARAAQRRGREVEAGDRLEYVKTEDGYDVAWEGAFEDLDEDYYVDQLSDLLGRLGIEARPADQRSLAEYL
jgi:DNA polymerase I